MTIVLILVCIVLALVMLYLWAIRGRTGHPGLAALQGWRYAHRGWHDKPAIPENSMAAFRRAVENGFGAELDVHLLADGGLAVFHDAKLIRTTGREGFIEDLTLADLPDYKLEGTEETIPTFRQVLDLFEQKAPLIIELKAERGNAAALCAAVCKELDNYTGVYCLESFDPRCILWLHKNRPDLIRGQLAQNFMKEPSGMGRPIDLVLTYLLDNALTRPDFVAYKFEDRCSIGNRLCRKLWKVAGASWTIRSKADLDAAEAEGLLPIFECFDPRV